MRASIIAHKGNIQVNTCDSINAGIQFSRLCGKLFLSCMVVSSFGEMSEWLKEHAWKACVGVTLPRVRIPLSPPMPIDSKGLTGLFLKRVTSRVTK